MNKRVAKLKLSINNLSVEELNKTTQADKNTHFLEISFDDTITTDGYSLLVLFKLPYPSKEVVVEEIETIVRENQQVILPNVCLKASGKLNIEFALKKDEELITVNKSLSIEVLRTINGTYFSAVAGEELQKTIDEQIREIKELLANLGDIQAGFNENAQNKTDEFNRNVVTKTEGFNENVNNKTTLFNQNSTTKTNEFNENVTTKTNEFNTLVENSKNEIEDKATESANTASTEANKQVVAQQEKSIQAVQEAGTSAVESINTTKTSAIETINSTTETVVKSVTDEGTNQVQAVQTQGTTTKQEVTQAGTNAVDSINTAKSEGINAIESATSTVISSVEEAGEEATREITESANTVVESVTTEGNRQIENITNKGIEQIEAITTEGIKQTEEVTTKGVEQIENIKIEGTKSLNSVREVQTEIENLLNNQEAEGNALSLNGKTGVQYDKEIRGVAGGYDGKFPLTIAEVDKIYLQEETGKFYVCIKAYNGTSLSAPNANFEELSVYKNRDRLDNLHGYKKITVTLELNKEIKVLDLNSLRDNNTNYPLFKIILFIHQRAGYGQATRYAEYMAWSRPVQEINMLIDHVANVNGKPNIRVDDTEMCFYVTQTYDVKCVCDIFICKFEPTIIF